MALGEARVRFSTFLPKGHPEKRLPKTAGELSVREGKRIEAERSKALRVLDSTDTSLDQKRVASEILDILDKQILKPILIGNAP